MLETKPAVQARLIGARAEEAGLYLAAIVECSDDAIISKNLDGVITSWNKGAERIFGYSAEEAVGQHITMLIPEEKHAEETQILQRLRRGERIEHFETIRRTKTGRLLNISLTASPIRNATGRIIGVSKISRDITEQKRMAQALEEARAQIEAHARDLERTVQDRTARLQAALMELESFSYSVSHDLRAPLRAMQQYSEALLEDYGGKLEEEGRHFLKRIVASSGRLDSLIREVLTYSRIVRADITPRPVEIGELIREVIHQYPTLRAETVEIELVEPLAPVLGNEAFMTQCLSNLLINAAKFVPSGTKPRIRMWTEYRTPESRNGEAHGETALPLGPKPTSMVRLWIQDNGIGISPEHHERIFRMFERVQGDRAYDGTGIGLAIVRKAVQRMGGSVGVESRLGEGSRFWIELPGIPN